MRKWGKSIPKLEIKLLALCLAVLLWLFVTTGKESEISIKVPVRAINVPPGLTLVQSPVEFLDVRLTGPKILLKRVHPEHLMVSLDLSQVGEGSIVFPELDKCLATPAGIKVIRVYPSRIEVTISRASR